MVMLSVVYWQPTGGLIAQADRLGDPYVSSHLAICCIYRMNWMNACSALLYYYYYLLVLSEVSWRVMFMSLMFVDSAGIGRTGAFIVIDVLLRRIEKFGLSFTVIMFVNHVNLNC